MFETGIVAQSIFGVFAIAVASLALYLALTEVSGGVGGKLLIAAFCLLVVGIGILCAWPLVLLVVDGLTGSDHLAGHIENAKAKDVANLASEVRGFASAAVALAIANVPGAVVVAHFLRKDRPAAPEPWFVLAVVLPLSAIVIAAKAQGWAGVTLPFGRLLVSVNDSVSAAGLAAFLVLWSSTWLGVIGMRLVAALPAGPVAAFVLPVAALPYYYGYYQGYGSGWMTLLFIASVLLGLVVNFVRQMENDAIEEHRNKSTANLSSQVLARVASGNVPDYVLFLRSFHGTGMLDTQSGDVEALDLETILARALRPRWLVGLGSRMERSIVGAGRVYFGNAEWWDSVRVLASHASHIIVVPSANAGTLKEIHWLHQERLLEKCILVMPPMAGEGGWHVDVYGPSTVLITDNTAADQRALWSAARAALLDSPGIDLPAYSARGAVLRLDAEGRVTRSVTLDLGRALFKVYRLKRAILAVAR